VLLLPWTSNWTSGCRVLYRASKCNPHHRGTDGDLDGNWSGSVGHLFPDPSTHRSSRRRRVRFLAAELWTLCPTTFPARTFSEYWIQSTVLHYTPEKYSEGRWPLVSEFLQLWPAKWSTSWNVSGSFQLGRLQVMLKLKAP